MNNENDTERQPRYLKTPEGWSYLAIVMDLYSRRLVGWDMSTETDTTLISQALMKAYH
ncbi:hypothetical protein XBJ1_3101 [Xenorhabdus bovienii SS-2004]|uniref:Integrase catalytic domain-containing protein n=1 Tax=Xenorhabdus bovienii (strain SS-2004) TaxID=406818 RepID=D3V3J5_XENBS|nr:hypothetical protein XBJ1_3101 [Xenorhabdus bovienii SS-2004]